jgi:hypothetical protein
MAAVNPPILNPATPSFLAIQESVNAPLLSVIDSMLAFETPSMRFLRVNSEAIDRMHSEMLAEFAVEDERQGRAA